jgi:hypothetical protein
MKVALGPDGAMPTVTFWNGMPDTDELRDMIGEAVISVSSSPRQVSN